MNQLDAAELQKQTVRGLQEWIWKQQRGARSGDAAVHSTGAAALDDLFPAGGVRPGSVIEWLGVGPASGAATVSWLAARRACAVGRMLAAIDTQHALFPLGMQLVGVDLARVVVIRPASEREAVWACEEALRCEAVGLVWASLERLDSLAFRRLQLAAEGSGSVAFLVRSDRALRSPSWAETRLVVRPAPSPRAAPCCRVEVAASQGRPRRMRVDILLDSLREAIHEISSLRPTHPLPVAS